MLGTLARRKIVFAVALLLPIQAQATIIITTAEVGPDVVFSFSGDLDVAGMNPMVGDNISEAVFPGAGAILFGVHNGVDWYDAPGYAAFPSFGPYGIFSGTGTGDTFQVARSVATLGLALGLPTGYSGGLISGSLTVPGSFASIGLIAGTYISTLPSGDTIRLAIPEPTAALLLACGVAGLAAAHRRRVA
jgi:hypothetical protein